MLYNGHDVEVKDQRGIVVDRGDIVAVGFSQGSSGVVRLGEIVGYNESRRTYASVICRLEIKWLYGTGRLPERPTTKIEVFTMVGSTRQDPWTWNNFYKVELPDG